MLKRHRCRSSASCDSRPAASIRSLTKSCPGVCTRHAGFTLIELLVVVSLLAALAAVSVGAYDNLYGYKDQQIAEAELRNIEKALHRFKQDTGFWPGSGPFSDRQGVHDLSQLLLQPTDRQGNELMPWDPESARGWRGPYLSRLGEGRAQLTVGAGLPGWVKAEMPSFAISDAFEAAAGGFSWQDWQQRAVRRGNPYLLFLEDPEQQLAAAGCRLPCVLSLGADGRWNLGLNDGDDLLLSLGGG